MPRSVSGQPPRSLLLLEEIPARFRAGAACVSEASGNFVCVSCPLYNLERCHLEDGPRLSRPFWHHAKFCTTVLSLASTTAFKIVYIPMLVYIFLLLVLCAHLIHCNTAQFLRNNVFRHLSFHAADHPEPVCTLNLYIHG